MQVTPSPRLSFDMDENATDVMLLTALVEELAAGERTLFMVLPVLLGAQAHRFCGRP